METRTGVWRRIPLSMESSTETSSRYRELSSTVSSGTQFDFTFNTPGVYHFHCFFHGALFGMAGTIAVGIRDYIPEAQK